MSKKMDVKNFINAIRSSWCKSIHVTPFEKKWRKEIIKSICARTGWNKRYIIKMTKMSPLQYLEVNLNESKKKR